MELTEEVLSRFVGGQMEIKNHNDGYLFRGEIASIRVFRKSFMVRFAWLGEGHMGHGDGWAKADDSELDFHANIEIYSVSEIDEGRISLFCNDSGEQIILFPPGGDRLDPAKVAGLTI